MVQQIYLTKQDKKQTIYHSKITSALFLTDYLITGTQDGFVNVHYLLGMNVICSRQISNNPILNILKVPQKPYLLLRTQSSLIFLDDKMQQKQEILTESQWISPTVEFFSGLQKQLEKQVVIPLQHNFVFTFQSNNTISVIEYVEQQNKQSEQNQEPQQSFKVIKLFKNNWKDCVFTPQLNLFIAIDRNQNISAYNINGKYFGTYNKQIKVAKIIHFQYNQYCFITVDNRVQVINIDLFAAENHVKFNESSVATKVVQNNDNSQCQNLFEVSVSVGYQPVVLDQQYVFDCLKMNQQYYEQRIMYLITVDNKCVSYSQQLSRDQYNSIITSSQINLLQQNYVDCNDWEKMNQSLNQFVQEVYNEQQTTKELATDLQERLESDIELYRQFGYDNTFFDQQVQDYVNLSYQIQSTLHNVCLNIIPTEAVTSSGDINQNLLDFNQHNFKAYCQNFNFIDFITQRQKVINYCKDILQKESKQQNDAILSYFGESQLLNIEQMSYMIYKGKPDWNKVSLDEDVEWSQYDELEELSEDDQVMDIDVSKYMPITEQQTEQPQIYLQQLSQYQQPDISLFDNIQLQEIEQGEKFEKYEEKIEYDLPEVKQQDVNEYVSNIIDKCVKDYQMHYEINQFVRDIVNEAEKQAEIQFGVKQFVQQSFDKGNQLAIIRQNEIQQQSKIFCNQCIQQAQTMVLAQRKAERIKQEQERLRLLEEERQRKLEEERQLRIKLEQERIQKLKDQFQQLEQEAQNKLTIQFNKIEDLQFNYKNIKQHYKDQVKQVQKTIADQIEAEKIRKEQERQKAIQLERERIKKEAEERKKLLKQKQLEEQERKRLEQEQLKAQKEKERQERKQLQEQKQKMMEQKRKEAELARKQSKQQNKPQKKKYEESQSDYSNEDYSYSYSYSQSYSYSDEPKKQPIKKTNKKYEDSESSEIQTKNQKKKLQKQESSYSYSSYSSYEYSYSESPKQNKKQQKQQESSSSTQVRKQINQIRKVQQKLESESYSQSKEQQTESSSTPVKQSKGLNKQKKYLESSSSEQPKQQPKQEKQQPQKKRLQLSESSSSTAYKSEEISVSTSNSERHKIKESITQQSKTNKGPIKSKYEESSEQNKQLVNLTQKVIQKQKNSLVLSSSSSSIQVKQQQKEESSSSEVQKSKQKQQPKQQKKYQETSSSTEEQVQKSNTKSKTNVSTTTSQTNVTSSVIKTSQTGKKRFQLSDDSEEQIKEQKQDKNEQQQKQKPLLTDSSEEEVVQKKPQEESSSESERRANKIHKSLLLKSKSKYIEDSDDKDFKKTVKQSKSESESSSSSEQLKKSKKQKKQKAETSSEESQQQNLNLLMSIRTFQQIGNTNKQESKQQEQQQKTLASVVKKVEDKAKEIIGKLKKDQQSNEIKPSAKRTNEIIEELMEEESEVSQQVVQQVQKKPEQQKIEFNKESSKESEHSVQEENTVTEQKNTITQQMITNDILDHHEQMQVTNDKDLLHKIISMSASNQLIYAGLCRNLQLKAFDTITDDMLQLISYYWPPSVRIGKQFVLLPTISEKSSWDTLLPAYDMVNHKRLSCKQLPPNLAQLQFIRTYRALRYDGILKYQGCGWSKYNQLYIFTDETPQTRLIDCFNNQQLFNEIFPTVNDIRIFIKSLVQTIAFLNSPQNRLMHRDLRPSTIYINKKHQPCLYHIGFMQSLNCSEPEEVNTVFAAPEVICGSCFLSSDTWSIGTLTLVLVLYKLCTDWSQLQSYKIFTQDLIQEKKDCPQGWTINEARNAKIIYQMAQASKDAVKIKNNEYYQIVKESQFELFAKQNKVKQIKSYKSCTGNVPYEQIGEEGFQLSNIFTVLRNFNTDEQIIDFIKQCYVFDATKRGRCATLLESKWLQQAKEVKQQEESNDEEKFLNKLQEKQNEAETKEPEQKQKKKIVKKVIRRLVKRN